MSIQISRRALLAASASGVVAVALPLRWAHAARWSRYGEAIVIDGLGGPGSLSAEPGAALTQAHVRDTRDSGLTCVHVTILPVGTTAPDAAFAQAVREIAQWEREIDAHPDTFTRVRTASDITAARKANRTGLVYGFQDGVAFETDLSRLDDLHRLGLRVVQPTYNRRNLLGDGCLEPANAGLSLMGVEAIERMNGLGILVDLSHCGRQTAADAMRVSKAPVAFTHTGCAALADHPRNRTDAELRAVADKGGVSGIYFMPYLSGGRQPTAADVLRHLEHMIKVAGEDHVSIGADGAISAEVLDQTYKDAFARSIRERRAAGIGAPQETEEGYLFASDLNTPRRFETLAAMLADRGHSATRIEKILGRNLLRVFSETWKA
ncbi:MAG: dipeptidase [Steroidobacter sp.]